MPTHIRFTRRKRGPIGMMVLSASLCAALYTAVSLASPKMAEAQSWLEGASDILNQTLGGGNSPDAGAGSGAASGSTAGTSSPLALSEGEIADGLREALRVGSRTVTNNLGAIDGFNGDPVIRIPLPDNLRRVQNALSAVGLGAVGDDVELRMNRAAETAMGDVGEILVSAIQAMTLNDAKQILTGSDTAATEFLQRTAGSDIRGKIRPVIESSLRDVGALNALDRMLADYDKLPFVPNVSADLTTHATDLAFKGVFHYIAQEEQAIRTNPVKRTTDILQRVFKS